ncbi:class F sortase [Alkalicoccobacillus porphyridii]|uniref:Class F sortase n=1 Tax=Alkalicoccobacillus porphyridii TaxID=2597270 RepID=A0A554A395_9BACI|nr:class F sortase [Alkalicoccobacillus porphyridii]TSB48167.1 class F sortase [Alkalicoccobacillus porphyridii]
MKWLTSFLTIGILLIGLVAFSTASTSGGTLDLSTMVVGSDESENTTSETVDLEPPSEEENVIQNEDSDAEFTFLDTAVVEEAEAIQSQIKQQEEQRNQGVTPAHIRIPSIGVDADIEDVGILENGQMGVPEDVDGVGWFEPGTNPGAIGNSVMAGHVDSRTGPAVFFDLEDLVEGDEIIIEDQDGQELTFEVKYQESYDRSNAPIQDIFGAANTRNLNLITCSGTFNRDEGTHEERLVVYAELVEEEIELDVDPPESPDNVVVQGAFLTWHAVREEHVAGYRIYREMEDDQFEHVESLSAHERKSFSLPEGGRADTYYVTTVDLYGQESDPSEMVGTSE